jgi:hypothetical protein
METTTEYPEIVKKIHSDFFSEEKGTNKALELHALGFTHAEGAIKVNNEYLVIVTKESILR